MSNNILKLHVQHPSEETPHAPAADSKGWKIYPFLAVVLLAMIIFAILALNSVLQTPARVATSSSSSSGAPLLAPGGQAFPALHLSGSQMILYARQNGLWLVATHGGVPRKVMAPGYSYNRSVPPLLTQSGQILYGGAGIWLTDPLQGDPRQLASLPGGQVLTSLVLSRDSRVLAWSSEPTNGNGRVRLYTGSLTTTGTLVYQQQHPCQPCLRAFAFLSDQTLLLTSDDGDTGSIHYGLWSLTIAGDTGTIQPHLLMADDPPQGPLALAPAADTLVYATREGAVPLPTDGSLPAELGTLSYANDLELASFSAQATQSGPAQTLVPTQVQQSNLSAMHWLQPPVFAPDGQSLLYVQFSVEGKAPFTRYSSLYTVALHGSGSQIQADAPQLLATATASLIETGCWLDSHTFTFYADGALYAFDLQQRALTRIVQLGAYGQCFATLATNK